MKTQHLALAIVLIAMLAITGIAHAAYVETTAMDPLTIQPETYIVTKSVDGGATWTMIENVDTAVVDLTVTRDVGIPMNEGENALIRSTATLGEYEPLICDLTIVARPVFAGGCLRLK